MDLCFFTEHVCTYMTVTFHDLSHLGLHLFSSTSLTINLNFLLTVSHKCVIGAIRDKIGGRHFGVRSRKAGVISRRNVSRL